MLRASCAARPAQAQHSALSADVAQSSCPSRLQLTSEFWVDGGGCSLLPSLSLPGGVLEVAARCVCARVPSKVSPTLCPTSSLLPLPPRFLHPE